MNGSSDNLGCLELGDLGTGLCCTTHQVRVLGQVPRKLPGFISSAQWGVLTGAGGPVRWDDIQENALKTTAAQICEIIFPYRGGSEQKTMVSLHQRGDTGAIVGVTRPVLGGAGSSSCAYETQECTACKLLPGDGGWGSGH